MSRLVDPTLCPDCRALLDSGATCTGCGLQVTGPLASELWQRMVAADHVVEQLRALSGLAPAPTSAPPPAPPASPARGLPAFPRSVTAPARTKLLPAASVPVVLLSLGGLCLLVAAVVFVAVAWSALGLTGRTLVLLGVTTLLALVAVVVTRKGLRGAAETFWLVVAGMLTVDLLGARSAGLAGLDALDWRGAGALVGLTLLVTSLAVGLWAHGQPVRRLYGADVVLAAGVALVCTTNAWFAENPAVACTLAVPLLATLTVALRSLLRGASYAVGGLTVATWLVLLLIGWDRALEHLGLGAWWSDLRGWPLLAAAAFAATATHLPGVPARVRPVMAGLALFPLVLLAEAPQTPGSQTHELAVAGGVLLALGLLAAAAPRVWAVAAAVLAGLGVLGLGLVLVAAPWDTLAALGTDGAGPVTLVLPRPGADVAAWTFGLLAVSLAATAPTLLRHTPRQHRSLAVSCLQAVLPAVVALGTLDVLLRLQPPLWFAVLVGALATSVAGGATWRVRDHRVGGWTGTVATAYLGLVTVRTAAADDLLLAVTLSVVVVAVLAVHVARETAGHAVAAGVSAGAAALAGAWTLVAWADRLGTDTDAVAVALAVYAALVGVLAAPATRQVSSRLTFEVSALAVGAVAVTYPQDVTTSALALTIVGSAVCLVAVAQRDREPMSWLGAALLGLATAMRVAAEVQAPELYTLPAALLLVAVGAWRLRTDADANSLTALGSGLTLGLLPSLLLALDEPISLRGALIAAAGVLVLAVGVQQRLAAPFVLGAVTTGLLALRHVEPYADAVPRWLSLGTVGLVLLLVGVSWESRRRNLETAGRYLADLR